MPQRINKKISPYLQFCSGVPIYHGWVNPRWASYNSGCYLSSLSSSPNGPRAFFPESLMCCCVDGLVNTAVRGAMSPAAASLVKMKWRSWDLSLPRLLHGCEYPAWKFTSQQPLHWREGRMGDRVSMDIAEKGLFVPPHLWASW